MAEILEEEGKESEEAKIKMGSEEVEGDLWNYPSTEAYLKQVFSFMQMKNYSQ